MFEKTLLVTGGAGFIGANFIDYFTQVHPEYRLVNLDLLTYAARREVFERQGKMENVSPCTATSATRRFFTTC